jgi:hypothetical protein
VWLHTQGHASVENEELFAFSNPGHVLFGAGFLLTVAGVLATLLDRGRATGTAGKILVSLLVVITGAVFTYGFATPTAHDHDESVLAHVDDAVTIAELTAQGLSQEEIFLVETSREGTDEHIDHGPALELDVNEVAMLADEVARARQAAERYRSIEAALAAGYIQVTQDLPRIGAHFLNGPLSRDNVFDPDNPEMLIYAYKDGGWVLYGLSYLSRLIGPDEERAPEGFTGPYDIWHWHKDWCFTLSGAHALGPEECAEKLGVFVPRTGYMTHFWVVDNPGGLFAHDHPDLTGSDEYIVPTLACALRTLRGSSQRAGSC